MSYVDLYCLDLAFLFPREQSVCWGLFDAHPFTYGGRGYSVNKKKKNPVNVVITFRVDDETNALLEKFALKHKIQMGELMRTIIKLFFSSKQKV